MMFCLGFHAMFNTMLCCHVYKCVIEHKLLASNISTFQVEGGGGACHFSTDHRGCFTVVILPNAFSCDYTDILYNTGYVPLLST